jgi:hypothetical protein
VRSRAPYRERVEPVERWDDDYGVETELADGPFGVSLPVHVI